MLIVTNGLVNAPTARTPDGLQLHPLLSSLQKGLAGRARAWFSASLHTPLSLLAWLEGQSPTALIASRTTLPDDVQQCWLASPFHARLMRDHLQVMPEGLLPWAVDDATALAELLNPLLEEDGMRLHTFGAALLLICREPLDAVPIPFAGVAGKLLPNRHPEGADGGRLMRLVAEIQMFLHNHRDEVRGGSDISGLWFWGGTALPLARDAVELSPVATRNPFLAAIAEARDAKLTITDAEQLDELIDPAAPLPRDIILFGDGHALWLTPSPVVALAAKLRRKAPVESKPDAGGDEDMLWQKIRGKL